MELNVISLDLLKLVCLLHVLTLCSFILFFVQDLIEDLKSELGGALETVVVALMKTPAEFDASTLRNAMKGAVRKNILQPISSRQFSLAPGVSLVGSFTALGH
jgi:hypothetical protein